MVNYELQFKLALLDTISLIQINSFSHRVARKGEIGINLGSLSYLSVIIEMLDGFTFMPRQPPRPSRRYQQ